MKLGLAIIIGPFIVAYKGIMFVPYAFAGSYNAVKALKKWRDKDKPTHGDAHFEDDKSLKKRGYFTNFGFLAGVTRKGRKVFTSPERTVVMLAPPGTGKSQHMIADIRAKMARPDDRLPHLMIGDAADELYRNTAPLLRARGYDIAKIDLVNPADWTKYDILSGLDPLDRFRFGRQLDAICRLLVTDEPNSKQPHFVEFARLLVKCAIIVNVKYEGNRKPIGDIVTELINEEKRADLIKRSKKYGDDLVTGTLSAMGKMQDKPEGISMITTALRKLEAWTQEEAREVTNYGNDIHGNYQRGWRFEQLLQNKKPVALFIRTGMNKAAAGSIARLIYGNAINAVSNLLDGGQKATRELELLIDEAGLLGHCDAIPDGYERLRKAGVRIRMCFLALKEMKDCGYEGMLAGCDLLLFGGSNELALRDLGSALAGEYTVHSRNESESASGGSKGKSEQPRRLIKPDEFGRLAENEVVMLLDNIVAKELKPWAKKKGGIVYL